MIENIKYARWTGAEFPAGTKIRVECRYDASSTLALALRAVDLLVCLNGLAAHFL